MDLSNLDSFRKQIAEAQISLQSLYMMRRVVDGKISDLKDLVRANANFLPDEERKAELITLDILKVPETITEAVKITLFIAAARKERLTPVQLKENAQTRGFDFSVYSNPMASIHSVLKRMIAAAPPEADFDEATATYGYIKGDFPFDFADESFYAKLDRTAWNQIITKEREIADKYAYDVIDQCIRQVSEKPRRKR